MKSQALLFLLLTILISGCGKSTSTVTDNGIDKALRQTIMEKNKLLFNAMVTSNNKAFKELGSPAFVKSMHAKLNRVIWPFRNNLIGTEFKVYQEFHNTHGTVPENYVIESEEHNYEFTFTNRNKETYVSMLKVDNHMDSYLVTVIYELIDGEWKLNDIFAGLLGIYGKDSQGYYNLAKEQADKQHIIDAFIYCDIADDLLDPANGHLKYNNEKNINFSKNRWFTQVNAAYRFPVVLSSVKTQPSIVGIAPIKNPEELTVVINYVTTIPLDNKATLATEYEKVKQEAESTFTGFDFSKKKIYYRAYSKDMVDFIGFTDLN